MQKKISMASAIECEGEHTFLPEAKRRTWLVRGLPDYLKKNDGISPVILNFGERDRAYLLKTLLKDAVVSDDVLGIGARGREPIVFGIYEHEGREFPVVGVCTGMGMPSASNILPEVLKHVALGEKYFFNGKEMPAGRMIIIRIGTAGGINSNDLEEPVVNRPDIINAYGNLATAGTVAEELGFCPSVLGMPDDSLELIRTKQLLEKYGTKIMKVKSRSETLGCDITWNLLFNHNSKELVDAMNAVAGKMGMPVQNSLIFSKNKLKFEKHVAVLQEMRKRGVLATEMEQLETTFRSSVLQVEYGITALTGALIVLVGALPGTGFPRPGNEKDKEEIETNLVNSVKIALGAAANLLWPK